MANSTFLQELNSSVKDELTSTRTYLRERRLLKKFEKLVRDNYDYIYESLILKEDHFIVSVGRVITDVCITIQNLTAEELYRLELITKENSDKEVLNWYHKQHVILFYKFNEYKK